MLAASFAHCGGRLVSLALAAAVVAIIAVLCHRRRHCSNTLIAMASGRPLSHAGSAVEDLGSSPVPMAVTFKQHLSSLKNILSLALIRKVSSRGQVGVSESSGLAFLPDRAGQDALPNSPGTADNAPSASSAPLQVAHCHGTMSQVDEVVHSLVIITTHVGTTDRASQFSDFLCRFEPNCC